MDFRLENTEIKPVNFNKNITTNEENTAPSGCVFLVLYSIFLQQKRRWGHQKAKEFRRIEEHIYMFYALRKNGH